MENPDNRDHQPANSAPAPTHWNIFRDPQWSFACPNCKAHVELNLTFKPQPGFPHMFAVCWACNVAYASDAWEKVKLEEMRDR